MLLGCFHQSQLEVGEESVVRGAQSQVDGEVLVHRGIIKALRHSRPVGLVGALCANLGPVVWAGGMRDMGSERSPCAPQVGAAPSEVTGGTPLSRRDVGWREHGAAQACRTRLGIELGSCGLAAMEGFHRESVPEDKRAPFLRTQGSEPVPGEEAFDSHD